MIVKRTIKHSLIRRSLQTSALNGKDIHKKKRLSETEILNSICKQLKSILLRYNYYRLIYKHSYLNHMKMKKDTSRVKLDD